MKWEWLNEYDWAHRTSAQLFCVGGYWEFRSTPSPLVAWQPLWKSSTGCIAIVDHCLRLPRTNVSLLGKYFIAGKQCFCSIVAFLLGYSFYLYFRRVFCNQPVKKYRQMTPNSIFLLTGKEVHWKVLVNRIRALFEFFLQRTSPALILWLHCHFIHLVLEKLQPPPIDY